MRRCCRSLSSLAAVLVFLIAAATARAAVIDFSSGAYTAPLDTPYQEDGFSFSVPAGNHTDCGGNVFPIQTQYCWHNGGGNVVVQNPVTLSFGGAPFDLISFDVAADLFGQNPLLSPFTLEINSSAGSLMVDGNALGTVVLNWLGITSATFEVNDDPSCTADACRHSGMIDNVVVNGRVPEPALALLSIAISAACCRRLRRP
jgi:hypothetical protein